MQQQIDDLGKRVAALEKKSRDVWDKIQIGSTAFGAVFIPIFLASSGYMISNATRIADDKRAEAQRLSDSERTTALAKMETERFNREIEHRADVETKNQQLKYLDLFYDDLYSADPIRQEVALEWVGNLVDANLRQVLSKLKPKDGTSEAFAAKAQEISAFADLVVNTNSILSTAGIQKIEVFYPVDRGAAATRGKKLVLDLANAGVSTMLTPSAETSDWFELRGARPGIDVRFDQNDSGEKFAAESLAALIRSILPQENVTISAVKKPTPHYISIFSTEVSEGGAAMTIQE